MAFDHRRALIEHLLAAAPDGLTLAQIAAQLHPPVPRRTLQYWLMRGQQEYRIYALGLARATSYYLNANVVPRPLSAIPTLPMATGVPPLSTTARAGPISPPTLAVPETVAREKVPAEDLIREFVNEQGRKMYMRRLRNPGDRDMFVAVYADTIEPVPPPPAAAL